MKYFLFVILMTFLSNFSVLAQKYTGYVYVDANKNGIYDKGEKTRSKIAVSDGLNVVLTDKKGAYNLLGHAKEKFIFITTPSGYKTNNEYYKRINSELTEYNFGVMPHAPVVKKDGSHSFIHISDTEIHNESIPECTDWISNLK